MTPEEKLEKQIIYTTLARARALLVSSELKKAEYKKGLFLFPSLEAVKRISDREQSALREAGKKMQEKNGEADYNTAVKLLTTLALSLGEDVEDCGGCPSLE